MTNSQNRKLGRVGMSYGYSLNLEGNLSKSISSKELGEWLAVFYQYNTTKEYQSQLEAIRCIFDAKGNKEFWNEVMKSFNNYFTSAPKK